MYRLRNYIFPFIGTTPIARLEVQDIMAVLRPLEMKRCYETSRRVLQIINQVFRYAVITGRARHNIAADLRGALRPRRVTHRAAVLRPEGRSAAPGHRCLRRLFPAGLRLEAGPDGLYPPYGITGRAVGRV